jgi:hypothetical protein
MPHAIRIGRETVNLNFEWQSPLLLARNKRLVVKPDDLDKIENVPGIYYLARTFAGIVEPFYIGETLKLRSRLKAHLATTRIADILRGMKVADAPTISQGPRFFHFAYLDANKNKQNTKKALQIAQKFMIREAIASNFPLLNSKLVVIRTHSLTFSSNGASDTIFEKKNSVAI